MQVAIVGAGIAGLSCATALEAEGCVVTLFDKGKRPGGRLSSLVLGERQWDFGAPYLVARNRRFADEVARWQQQGFAAGWPDGPMGAMVGVPAMSALVAEQCAGRAVHFNAQVQRLEQGLGGWRIVGPEFAEGPFDAVVVAVPECDAVFVAVVVAVLECGAVLVAVLVPVLEGDAVLVAHQSRAQDVKRVVDGLKAGGRTIGSRHRVERASLANEGEAAVELWRLNAGERAELPAAQATVLTGTVQTADGAVHGPGSRIDSEGAQTVEAESAASLLVTVWAS